MVVKMHAHQFYEFHIIPFYSTIHEWGKDNICYGDVQVAREMTLVGFHHNVFFVLTL